MKPGPSRFLPLKRGRSVLSAQDQLGCAGRLRCVEWVPLSGDADSMWPMECPRQEGVTGRPSGTVTGTAKRKQHGFMKADLWRQYDRKGPQMDGSCLWEKSEQGVNRHVYTGALFPIRKRILKQFCILWGHTKWHLFAALLRAGQARTAPIRWIRNGWLALKKGWANLGSASKTTRDVWLFNWLNHRYFFFLCLSPKNRNWMDLNGN